MADSCGRGAARSTSYPSLSPQRIMVGKAQHLLLAIRADTQVSVTPPLASGKPQVAREGKSNKLWIVVGPSKGAIWVEMQII